MNLHCRIREGGTRDARGHSFSIFVHSHGVSWKLAKQIGWRPHLWGWRLHLDSLGSATDLSGKIRFGGPVIINILWPSCHFIASQRHNMVGPWRHNQRGTQETVALCYRAHSSFGLVYQWDWTGAAWDSQVQIVHRALKRTFITRI